MVTSPQGLFFIVTWKCQAQVVVHSSESFELKRIKTYMLEKIWTVKMCLIHVYFPHFQSARNGGECTAQGSNSSIVLIKNYDIFVDGGTITSKGESTIIEIENEKIHVIREGALKKEDIVI